jgi:hypothetical protein
MCHLGGGPLDILGGGSGRSKKKYHARSWTRKKIPASSWEKKKNSCNFIRNPSETY